MTVKGLAAIDDILPLFVHLELGAMVGSVELVVESVLGAIGRQPQRLWETTYRDSKRLKIEDWIVEG